MSSTFTFNWPSGPKEVIVTGTFDKWKKSLPLVKQADGSFELTVPFAKDTDVLYKYVVDGEWLTNPAQSISTDENGIENNILTSEHLFSYEAQSKSPESGGLAVVPGSLNTTVMPSSQSQQKTLGEPGIFIPKDEENLKAFTVYENTDRDLNNSKSEDAVDSKKELTSEEKKKQKKKLKRTKYKLNKKAKAGQAKDASSPSSSESSPVPEDENSKDGVIASATAGAKEVFGLSNKKEDGSKSSTNTSATEASKDDLEQPLKKEATPKAPYSLTQKDLAESTIVVPAEAGDISESTAVEDDKEPAPYAYNEKDLTGAKIAAVPSGLKESEKKPAGNKDDSKSVEPVVVDKKPAPYALTKNELAQPEVVPAVATDLKPKEEEARSTLDPTVIGVVGASAGSESAKEAKSPDAVAKKISDEKPVERSVQPAIIEPIVPVEIESFKSGVTSNVSDAYIVPGSKKSKEVTALPVKDEQIVQEEEIIIAQGGHDVKEIEEQIAAAVDGPVSVEELQPTVSEAKDLAEEAHIPRDEIKVAPVPAKQKKSSSKKSSSNGKASNGDGKEKKKGLFSKIKKIFK